MKFQTHILVGILVAVLFVMACQQDEKYELLDENIESLKLNIRWVQSHENETMDDGLTSLKWSLSFLGAELPANSFNKAVTLTDEHIMEVNFDELGINDNGLAAFSQLIYQFKASAEYSEMKSIDLGRFIMLTLNSSNHYYAITGARPTLKEFIDSYTFENREAAIVESAVSNGNRLISIPSAQVITDIAFLCKEGPGEISNGSFEVKEYEVVDIMPNGQNRFAVYNESGNLKSAGDTAYGLAGKPSKCLWCHETFIQPPFSASTAVPGYMGPAEFLDYVTFLNQSIEQYREFLITALDYSDQKQHELMEITYISFMEPSIYRLSKEWKMSENEVTIKLAGYDTHIQEEFPWLGNLYHRNEIKSEAPYSGLDVPDHAREFSLYEPDLIIQ